jgi:hypothetical protein
MIKTVLVIEITHKKPLPTRLDVTDAAAQRIYGWLYSQGVEAGVNAALTTMPKEPGSEHEGGA